jgi:hypothetical protein
MIESLENRRFMCATLAVPAAAADLTPVPPRGAVTVPSEIKTTEITDASFVRAPQTPAAQTLTSSVQKKASDTLAGVISKI